MDDPFLTFLENIWIKVRFPFLVIYNDFLEWNKAYDARLLVQKQADDARRSARKEADEARQLAEKQQRENIQSRLEKNQEHERLMREVKEELEEAEAKRVRADRIQYKEELLARERVKVEKSAYFAASSAKHHKETMARLEQEQKSYTEQLAREEARRSAEQERAAAERARQRKIRLERERLQNELVQAQELASLELHVEKMQWKIANIKEILRAQEEAKAAPAAPAVEAHLSDRQIESLALKAVTRIASLPPVERDSAWEEWNSEIARHYGAYVAGELRQQAERMRNAAQT